MNRLLNIGVLGAAALSLLVACGGGTPAASTASPAARGTSSTGSAAATSLATIGPSSAASTSPSAAPSAAPALPTTALPTSSPVAVGPSLPAIFFSHADAALEALLPATVSGTALQKYSLTLTQILDAGGDRPGIDAFLQTIGKTEADGSFAAALDPTGAIDGGIEAFKVSGANAGALLAGITSVELSDLGVGATTTQATVGGKPVTVISVGSDVNDTEWIYGHDDIVFVVNAADEADATAFLETLP